jgi:hypothetical protein
MDLETIDQTSDTFLGQWKQLVSTTNWEKGRIIYDWRTALTEADAPAGQYSDEAWSQRVGNVTPQHVGRLRRVYERFAESRETYLGLYWSHFQAALDWDDAELWLEGAVQSDWSVAQMRKTRWEANGAVADQQPTETDNIVAEVDEDSEPIADVRREVADDGGLATVRDLNESSQVDMCSTADAPSDDGSTHEEESPEPTREIKRPFAELPSLPADITDAFESFKLCILRHRLAGWQEISLDDMLGTLDALKELAMAPSDN